MNNCTNASFSKRRLFALNSVAYWFILLHWLVVAVIGSRSSPFRSLAGNLEKMKGICRFSPRIEPPPLIHCLATCYSSPQDKTEAIAPAHNAIVEWTVQKWFSLGTALMRPQLPPPASRPSKQSLPWHSYLDNDHIPGALHNA